MKKVIIIFTAFLAFSNSIFTQEITTQEKREIIAYLDSSNALLRLYALDEISASQIIEAIPILENKIWDQKEAVIKYQYLQTLYSLDYDGIIPLVYDFIDSTDYFDELYSSWTPLELKVRASKFLFELGDYSTIDYLFDLTKIDTVFEYTFHTLSLWKIVAKNLPEYSVQAKTELKRIIYYNEQHRNLALLYYYKAFGQDVLPIVEYLFNNFETSALTLARCIEILAKERPENYLELIKFRITQEPEPLKRESILWRLLDNFNDPLIYNLLRNYIETEDDSKVKLINELSLNYYIPIKPEITVTELEMIENLINYNNQCYSLDWYKDHYFQSKLNTILIKAKNDIILWDSLSCAKEIRSFQESIEQVHADSAGSHPKYVSKEAYKFLYYYPKYILERLPKIPVSGGK